MSELLQKLNGEQILGLFTIVVAVIVGGIIAVTAIVTGHCRKARQGELEAALKQEMLQRGMSAEDIVRVVTASRGCSSPGDAPAPGQSGWTADCPGKQA